MSFHSRKDSWSVDPTTRAVLRQVAGLGFVVSVHRLPSSLLGRTGENTEMHAVKPDTGELFLVRTIEPHSPDADYRCACVLAQKVGIRLED